MKQLTCEMCGSTDMIKQDGVFVCQTCGTKYSIEEARKLLIEGTVEVTGTVKIDESDKIDNYYQLAKNAYDSDNKSEAELYCNKIIEIEPAHIQAWLIKGMVAGWQSTVANCRIDEMVQCFCKALDCTSTKEEYLYVLENMCSQFYSISIAYNNLWLKFAFEDSDDYFRYSRAFLKFYDWQIELQKSRLINSIRITETLSEEEKGCLNNNFFDNINNSIKEMRNAAYTAAIEKYNKEYNYFTKYNGGYPGNYELDSMIKTHVLITNSMDTFLPKKEKIEIEEFDYANGIIESWITMQENYNGFCSYRKEYTDYGSQYVVDKYISADGIRESNNKIAKCRKLQKTLLLSAINNSTKKLLETWDDGDEALVDSAVAYFKAQRYYEACVRFEAVINKMPNDQIGYIGKSASIQASGFPASYDFLFTPIIEASSLQSSYSFSEYKKYLLNFYNDEAPLLHEASYAGLFNVVKALVVMGANINGRCKNMTTALWMVSHEKLSEDDAEAKRQIAKYLIDNGAELDVTNKGGVALYNKDTDPVIASYIKAKNPSVSKGEHVKKPARVSDGWMKAMMIITYLCCLTPLLGILESGILFYLAGQSDYRKHAKITLIISIVSTILMPILICAGFGGIIGLFGF